MKVSTMRAIGNYLLVVGIAGLVIVILVLLCQMIGVATNVS